MNKTTGLLKLENMEFYAYHGVLDEERKIGGYYTVSLTLELDITAAINTDNLEHTINYAQVYEIAKEQMAIKSKLIEHIAGRIAKTLLTEFDQLESVEICLTKINPPVNADLPKASITLKLNQD